MCIPMRYCWLLIYCWWPKIWIVFFEIMTEIFPVIWIRMKECQRLPRTWADFVYFRLFQKACDSIQSPLMAKEHCKSKMDLTEVRQFHSKRQIWNTNCYLFWHHSYTGIKYIYIYIARWRMCGNRLLWITTETEMTFEPIRVMGCNLKSTHFSKMILKL